MNLDSHKSKKGLYKLLSYYASIERGASYTVMSNFPNLKAVAKSWYDIRIIELSECWLGGYFSVYSNFDADLNPSAPRGALVY